MIIGITGKMGSGKDTLGGYLVEDMSAKHLMFAKHLKDVVKLAMGWTDEHVYGDKKEVVCPIWNVTPRYVLQRMGTDFFRDMVRKDFFLKHMENQIKIAELEGFQHVVITDVRFDEEAQFITDLGGMVIRVTRSNNPLSSSLGCGHASEAGVSDDLISFTWPNDGTLEDVKDFASTVCSVVCDGEKYFV